jgi:hypothetical protein
MTLNPTMLTRTLHFMENQTISPFSRLPTDLIRIIFRHVAHRDRAQDFYMLPSCPLYLSDSAQALVISHVCHGWRMVALEMPSLWASPAFRHEADGLDFEILDRAGDTGVSAWITMELHSYEELDFASSKK